MTRIGIGEEGQEHNTVVGVGLKSQAPKAGKQAPKADKKEAQSKEKARKTGKEGNSAADDSFERLCATLADYDPQADFHLLRQAFEFAQENHAGQQRSSGAPYISHPLAVAQNLADLRLDLASIMTALLHDVVEDTDVRLVEITQLFGEEIASLVDGVTKLTRLETQSEKQRYAENFRKLILAISDDIRVLLVKLADRRHNAQTLAHIPDPEKRRRIARDTMDIYAPLADRIGMEQLKSTLEDAAFAELNPVAHASVKARLTFLLEAEGDLPGLIRQGLIQTFAQGGIRAEIYGRVKAPYSIWQKMQTKNIAFEQLLDIMAFRVVVADVPQCYEALGLLHAVYPVVFERFKDYLSTPKSNGYRSLHTGLLGPHNHLIEVQIRTQEMHEEAEYGVAAHWNYKQAGGTPSGQERRQYRWLRELLEIVEHATSPEELLEHSRLEMFQDQVFCFTPKGDLIDLPSGATTVDFAYAIHSKVGDHAVGAKVNGRIVPLRQKLNNGDQVEITTAKTQTPSPDWEKFVASGKAKACIRRYIRREQLNQHILLGQQLFAKALRALDAKVTLPEATWNRLLQNYNCATPDSLYALIGAARVNAADVARVAYPQPLGRKRLLPSFRPRTKPASAHSSPLSIQELIPGLAVHYARCCHPLPGDQIVGIVTTGKGITIHTADCEGLARLKKHPERWVKVSWVADDHKDVANKTHLGRLRVIISNKTGSFGTFTTTIGVNKGNIHNLKIVNRSADFFEILVDVEVENLERLTQVMAALRASDCVVSVERSKK